MGRLRLSARVQSKVGGHGAKIQVGDFDTRPAPSSRPATEVLQVMAIDWGREDAELTMLCCGWAGTLGLWSEFDCHHDTSGEIHCGSSFLPGHTADVTSLISEGVNVISACTNGEMLFWPKSKLSPGFVVQLARGDSIGGGSKPLAAERVRGAISVLAIVHKPGPDHHHDLVLPGTEEGEVWATLTDEHAQRGRIGTLSQQPILSVKTGSLRAMAVL